LLKIKAREQCTFVPDSKVFPSMINASTSTVNSSVRTEP